MNASVATALDYSRIPITSRQQQALDIIRLSIAENGYPPTLREIGELMGIRSTNGVNDHLQALERKGYIQRGDMKSRCLRLLQRANVQSSGVPACGCAESAALRIEAQGLRLRVGELESKLARLAEYAGDI